MGFIDDLMNFVNEEQKKNTSYHAYDEHDQFTLSGKAQFSVLDFWRYRYAQLAGLHAEIAEFIVARALGISKSENVNYWTAYDMSYQGHRIEVKESSYVHPWNKTRVSSVRNFSIAPSNNAYWNKVFDPNANEKTARQSEIYVFCLNINQDPQDPQPLNLDLWEFYVVPTYKINQMAIANNNPNQKTISLNVVRKLARKPCHYDALRGVIDQALADVDQHYGCCQKE